MTESVQRVLLEVGANEYPRVERGMTLGSVIEHRKSGDWAVITDVLDDGRIRFLNLEEVGDDTIRLFEDAHGLVEHLEIARNAAAADEGGEYFAPPHIFDVLGPVHPDYQRGEDDE